MNEKTAFRALAKERLAFLSASRKAEASEQICRRLRESDAYQNAPAVLLYAATENEPSLTLLEAFCREDGKQTLYPRCERAGEMNFFYATERELVPGHYGIREPLKTCPPCLFPPANALCVVPALCFDEAGNRLGHGGGYYDRYLASHPLTAVGVCFKELLLSSLPTEETDLPVSRVITG